MKNKISKELKAWVRAVHGRRKKLAQHCGVSGGSVDSWLHERNGIAQRHHQKIFELAGVHPVCSCNYSVSVTGNKLVTNQQLTGQ